MKSSPFIHRKISYFNCQPQIALDLYIKATWQPYILYMFLAQVYGDTLDSHLLAIDL